MPLNLELKARLRCLDEARTQAASLGARLDRLLLQTDSYYRVPRGRLKLRTLPDDSAELILRMTGCISPKYQPLRGKRIFQKSEKILPSPHG